MQRSSTAASWLALTLVLILTFVLLLIVAEWSARIAFRDTPEEFPARSEVSRTTEYDATASINIFGFRGTERKLAPGQVAAIGDSFTFGYGVNDQDTWPAVLSAKLNSRGFPVSVYNLGRPGADPDDYLAIARNYIPVLKPRLVIISILQGDDPGQFIERHTSVPSNVEPHPRDSFKLRVRHLLPGLDRAANVLDVSLQNWSASSEAGLLTGNWRKDAARYISAEYLKRLPEDLLRMVQSGNLSPPLVELAESHPRHYVQAYGLSTIDYVERGMKEIIGKIVTMAKAQGGSVILLSMPFSLYFNDATRKTYSDLGFELPATNECVMDTLVEKLARSLDVGFMSPTNELRRERNIDYIWFKYDGHLTVKGNSMIANYLESRIATVMHGELSQTKVPYLDEPCSGNP
jgi:hypothetical protein